MSKPFSLAVLQARVRKMLKKREESAILVSGDITVDLSRGVACKAGAKLELSGTDFAFLLIFLSIRAGSLQKVSCWSGSGMRKETMWMKYTGSNNPSSPRKGGGRSGHPERIRTVHGQGTVAGDGQMSEMEMMIVVMIFLLAVLLGIFFFRRRYFRLYQAVQRFQKQILKERRFCPSRH